jgi:hypothetical protein
MIIKFNPKFKGPIRRGEKTLTIREKNIKYDKLRPGDTLYLVADPITCKDDVIKTTKCTQVDTISIVYNDSVSIYINGAKINDFHLRKIAKEDGSQNITDFLSYHCRSMEGYIIHW